MILSVIKMCRMVSFLSLEEESVERYFNALVHQALKGKKAPHGDGWGTALYGEKSFWVKKSCEPVWKSEFSCVLAHAGVFHARKTTSSPVKVSFSHPFLFSFNGKDWAFVHNGSIIGYSDMTKIDTQLYLELFEQAVKEFGIVSAVGRTIKKIKSFYSYTSLNFLLISEDEMYAFKILSCDEDEYHSIFYASEKERIVFSTEPFNNAAWKELKNGEFAHAQRVGKLLAFEKGRW